MNPSKQRGTAAETAVVRWLQAHGHPFARRNPPAGRNDIGDIGGVRVWARPASNWTETDPLVIEVKAYKDLAAGINRGIAELEAEKTNAGTDRGVLIVKRRGKGDPGEWLAVRLVKHDPELAP